MTIDPNLSVDRLMQQWPATMAVFMRHRMACIGCPVGSFHTIAECSAQYDVPLETLLQEIDTVISNGLKDTV